MFNHSSIRASAAKRPLATVSLKLKSSSVWVEICLVRGCTSRTYWQCPASRIQYHEKCRGLPIVGRERQLGPIR